MEQTLRSKIKVGDWGTNTTTEIYDCMYKGIKAVIKEISNFQHGFAFDIYDYNVELVSDVIQCKSLTGDLNTIRVIGEMYKKWFEQIVDDITKQR